MVGLTYRVTSDWFYLKLEITGKKKSGAGMMSFYVEKTHKKNARRLPKVCRVEYRVVSENSGTPKSSILIGFSIINHPFWGTPIFGNTHIPL